MPIPLPKEKILDYLQFSAGLIATDQICRDLNILTSEGRSTLRVMLHRLVADGVLARTGRDGVFRIVENGKVKMDWRNADETAVIDLKWPFQLEKYALVYPKNVVILAGQKQAGKTTFLLDFVRRNMYQHKIEFFNSETGKEEMKIKLLDAGFDFDVPFEIYERYDNFADVIDPDAINVIDYLDLNSEFYLVGLEIDNIFKKLKRGIAVIGMQIPPPSVTYVKGIKHVIDRDYAYGGGLTAKRAFIYLSMISGQRLKIKHVKKPAQRGVHPENMMWSYKIDDCGQFTDILRYHEEQGNL